MTRNGVARFVAGAGAWAVTCAVVGLVVTTTGVAHADPGPEAEVECVQCHDTPDAAAFGRSVHGPTGKRADSLTAACQACHEDVRATEAGHDAPRPVNCARCHAEAREQTRDSVHGEGDGNGTAPRARCVDCHSPHEMVRGEARDPGTRAPFFERTCGRCHEAAWHEYETSFHGRSRNAHVATCADCHGSHDIRSAREPSARTYRLRQAEMCASGHADPDVGCTRVQIDKVRHYFQSAHGLAVEKSGLVVSATCVDCHGAHHVEHVTAAGSPVYRARTPETCGRCHLKAREQYLQSVHGRHLLEGNTDVPVCNDCHTSHEIQSPLVQGSTVYPTHVSDTCLKCHENARFIDRYGFPPLRKETYLSSYHGAASKLGDTQVANCGSCHGSHDIRRSDDPLSMTHPSNMKKTCGQCHKTGDPSRPMVVGKIHITVAKESHWVTSLVRNIYLGIIFVALGFFAFYIPTDLRRRLRDARRNDERGAG